MQKPAIPRWVSFLFSIFFAWSGLISVLGCTARRQQGDNFEKHHINAWYQVWLDGQTAGEFRFDQPPEALIAISGVFTLGEQKAQILFRLASYPSFDDGTIIYQNRIMKPEEAKKLIATQYDLDSDTADMWFRQMWDHNGAFRDCLELVYPSFTGINISPSIHWGYCLSGHGGGADNEYTAGMIRIHTLGEWLYRSHHRIPDFLEIESCNADGITSVPDILAQQGVFPKRIAFTPCGFPTTAYLGSIARAAGLESEQDLFHPVLTQWGLATPDGWTLERLNVEPVISVHDTADLISHLADTIEGGFSKVTQHHGPLDGQQFKQTCILSAIILTMPEVHNFTLHQFVEG